MSGYRDTYEYKTGTVAELKIASKLRNGGVHISIVRHGTSVAPLLYGWGGDLVLPDMQGFWPHQVGQVRGNAWVESKLKSTCGVMECMDNLRTTGIDLHHWQHYDQVQQVTGYPVVLVFVQREQDGVFIADLDTHRVPAVGNAKGKMVFWALDSLQRVCSYTELMETRPAVQQLEMPLFYPPVAWDQARLL